MMVGEVGIKEHVSIKGMNTILVDEQIRKVSILLMDGGSIKKLLIYCNRKVWKCQF